MLRREAPYELSGREGNERHNASSFYGPSKFALMLGARSVFFRRINLSERVHKTSQKIRVFVIHGIDFVGAKMTLFHNVELLSNREYPVYRDFQEYSL
jgi:hypothetical protein